MGLTKEQMISYDNTRRNNVKIVHYCNKNTISLMRYEIEIIQNGKSIFLNATTIKSINQIINSNYKECIKQDLDEV